MAWVVWRVKGKCYRFTSSVSWWGFPVSCFSGCFFLYRGLCKFVKRERSTSQFLTCTFPLP